MIYDKKTAPFNGTVLLYWSGSEHKCDGNTGGEYWYDGGDEIAEYHPRDYESAAGLGLGACEVAGALYDFFGDNLAAGVTDVAAHGDAHGQPGVHV